MNDSEINIEVDNNYISLMGHTITTDDMIENLYYRTDISWAKNVKCFNLLYLNGLKESSILSLNTLLIDKLNDEIKKADEIKPIFRFIDSKLCDKYNLYSIGYKKSSRTENYTIPIKIFKSEEVNINEIVENLEPLYSTLKYKIKEERITRNIRNDINALKKSNYIYNIKIGNEIRELRKIIKINDEKCYTEIDKLCIISDKYYNYYRNEIKKIKTMNYYLSFGLIVNFTLFTFLFF